MFLLVYHMLVLKICEVTSKIIIFIIIIRLKLKLKNLFIGIQKCVTKLLLAGVFGGAVMLGW